MLVLSRRTNEIISFPELGITLKILKVKGRAVSVGIEAPDDIQILRGELVEVATGFNDPPPVISQVLPSAISLNTSNV